MTPGWFVFSLEDRFKTVNLAMGGLLITPVGGQSNTVHGHVVAVNQDHFRRQSPRDRLQSISDQGPLA